MSDISELKIVSQARRKGIYLTIFALVASCILLFICPDSKYILDFTIIIPSFFIYIGMYMIIFNLYFEFFSVYGFFSIVILFDELQLFLIINNGISVDSVIFLTYLLCSVYAILDIICVKRGIKLSRGFIYNSLGNPVKNKYLFIEGIKIKYKKQTKKFNLLIDENGIFNISIDRVTEKNMQRVIKIINDKNSFLKEFFHDKYEIINLLLVREDSDDKKRTFGEFGIEVVSKGKIKDFINNYNTTNRVSTIEIKNLRGKIRPFLKTNTFFSDKIFPLILVFVSIFLLVMFWLIINLLISLI